jgi:hypothetical protein
MAEAVPRRAVRPDSIGVALNSAPLNVHLHANSAAQRPITKCARVKKRNKHTKYIVHNRSDSNYYIGAVTATAQNSSSSLLCYAVFCKAFVWRRELRIPKNSECLSTKMAHSVPSQYR